MILVDSTKIHPDLGAVPAVVWLTTREPQRGPANAENRPSVDQISSSALLQSLPDARHRASLCA